MSTAQCFRTACEECHTRKVRCKPSSSESRGGTRCEACRINGRKCLFSLRSKTGRPRNSTVPGYSSTSTFLSSPPSAASTDVAFTSSSSSSGSNTGLNSPESNSHEYLSLHQWPSSVNDQRDQRLLDFDSILDQSCNHSHERRDASMGVCRCCSDGAWRSPGFEPPIQNVFPAASGCNPVADPLEDMLSSMYPAESQQLALPVWDQRTLETLSIASTSPNLFLPPFAENFPGPASEHLTSATPFPANTRKPETVSDIVRTIELCDKVRKYGHAIPKKNISLLSSRDAADVHEMLTSIDKLCSKINSIIPQQPQPAQLRDQPTFILIFTAVMQAIEQTVDRLGSVAEFEHASQAEASSLGINSMVMNFPQLQIEHLLSLTRLEFYLLQMKSFIAHFDTSLELLAAAEFMFHPAESSARLLSYHRCLETVLWRWKNEWRK